MAKIYTKKGDGGFTKLGDGSPVHKSNVQVEAYGTVDELTSFLGLAVTAAASEDIKRELVWIQNRLFVIGSLLAFPAAKLPEGLGEITAADLKRLEGLIDAAAEKLPPLTAFIIPGGTKAAALLHCARSICRRAERAASSLELLDCPKRRFVLPFLNRLSDYLFEAARLENHLAGKKDQLAEG
ncbi:MAG TPA: cob(I)yrinic acid a,c-diamide adenosyltransferase [Firmicutes bacterium]|nr:cob(I)yrinic acid a,c-diamide adenosyltransferase [Bacillota bacterium]